MRFLRPLAFRLALLVAVSALAQGTADVPRNETLIVENPEGTIKNAGWFNIWAMNAGGQSTGLHQLAMDTFWYIDPDHGLNGVWDNSLASEPPIYNADFTEMTVKLRPGIYWSDGVEFTADDVVFTINTHLNTKGLVRSAQCPAQRRERRGARQVHGDLQAQEAELAVPLAVHSALERDVDDAQARLRGEGSAEVRLQPAGFARAYTLHSYDPNGQWFTWQKRDDWQRTTLGRFGEPGPSM